MKKYIINKKTCVLIKKSQRTLIIEDNNTFYVEKNIKSVINDSCKYYGSNYKGRIEAVGELLNTKYKNPILLNGKKGLIIFPTGSIRNNEVMFINYKKIINYEVYSKYLRIFLTNNIIITPKMSKHILSEQLVKCILFDNLINSRNN